MPIPPCTCWAVAATRAPASAAQNFAMRGLAAGRPALGEQPGGLPHGPADRLDVDERVGHPLLHGLEAADRPAELLAFGGVGGGHAQRTLRDAELDRAQPDKRAGIERLEDLGCRRRAAGPSDDGTVQDDVGVRLAVGRHGGSNLDAVGVGVERKTPTSPSSSVAGTSIVWASWAAGTSSLVPSRRQPSPSRRAVVAGAVGSERPGSVRSRGEKCAAVDDVGEVALLLCRRRRSGRWCRRRAAGWRRPAPARRSSPPRREARQLEEAVAAAADVLGQRDSEQVGGREFAPERSVVAHVAGFELGEVLGCGAVLEELARDLGDRLLFFGEGEVHVRGLSGRAELVQHEVLPSMVSNVS